MSGHATKYSLVGLAYGRVEEGTSTYHKGLKLTWYFAALVLYCILGLQEVTGDSESIVIQPGIVVVYSPSHIAGKAVAHC